MPTDPTPRPADHGLAIYLALAAVLLIALAVLAPQSLIAVSVTVIAGCQLRRLM